ncbi:fatty-acyl-CoA synthase [Desulfoprunum benzoelyticum]|uniref:Fatty-acyl-CoA synthase n=1 Tax=Desulfoprunum benzoelyticum TaxID=1506996 RepID=A0A840V5K8_9BACT|nr:AMP-binding protein [Desulfoprunum benzoelyticum]MBB5349200.1 fatty-acyl-CoA synthase [Desulfoprunum benzoelyticum]
MMYTAGVNHDILSPVSFLERSARVYPDKTAVIYGDRRYSYREFQARIHRLANALRSSGIAPGDKVIFLCPNTPPLLEAHFAVPMIGAVLVCVNTQLSAGEYRYIIDHSDARAVFTDSEYATTIAAIRDDLQKVELYVTINDTAAPPLLPGPDYEDFIAGGAATAPDLLAIIDEDTAITINYTSGTTGKPKGVMCSHRSTCLHALGEIIETSLTSDAVYLWTLPIFHCNGWGFVWAVTAVGGTHVCLRHCEPGRIFHLIEQERVSHLCAAPNVLLAMVCDPQSVRVKLRRPLQVLTAGASPSPTILQGMEDIGADITHVYGLTELHGPHSVCAWQAPWTELDPEALTRMKARQGVPYTTSLHMEVVDPISMQPVPPDGKTIGEVVMRGNNVMLGYYKDREATDQAFRGGWFHSGDLGVMHPDGYVQIMDRVADIIVRGGDIISSVEIEEVISRHPDVLEVAVVSAPDPVWGEVPKAFVVAKPGRTPTAEAIIDFCRQNHADFKAPQTVEFAQLPKTATGKTIKARLRDQEWFGFQRKVS